MQEGDEVDSHKGDQRAEGDDFGGEFPGNGEHADVGEDADDPDIVDRIAFCGADMAKDFFGEDVVAAHAVEETGSADVSGEAAGDAGNEKHDAVGVEEPGTAGGAGDVHEGGFGIQVGGVIRQNTLGHVDLEATEESGENADENGCEKDIAAGIFYFFGEDGDAIETDEDEGGKARSRGNRVKLKGVRVVDGLQRNQAGKMLVKDDVTEGLDDEGEGDQDHEGEENFVGAGGEFDALDGHESNEADG